MKDEVPRYAPEKTFIVRKGLAYELPIVRYVSHPPNNHPPGCPLVNDCTALEMVTEVGSRWWGFDKCWINSELKMVIQGFDDRNEIVSGWKVCTTI
jgi:hypothetical protein